jgi:ribosomal-protein-alanine acetyltransferase
MLYEGFTVSLKRYPDTKHLPMPVSIRAATLNDVPAILALERQAPGAAHWTLEQYHKLVSGGVVLVAEYVAEYVAEHVAGHLVEPAPAPCKSREERDTPCGFICARAVAGEWEIENVAVAAEFFRRGIANELVRELIQRARSEAAAAILLEVRESNLPARGLYEKHGLREVGRRRAYYTDPVEDAILYALRFDR